MRKLWKWLILMSLIYKSTSHFNKTYITELSWNYCINYGTWRFERFTAIVISGRLPYQVDRTSLKMYFRLFTCLFLIMVEMTCMNLNDFEVGSFFEPFSKDLSLSRSDSNGPDLKIDNFMMLLTISRNFVFMIWKILAHVTC